MGSADLSDVWRDLMVASDRDLHPEFWTVSSWKIPVMIGGPEYGGFDEEIEVFGGADRFVLKQADDGTSVGEVCRKAGISEATYYNWRKKYAGLMPSEMKRLRQLEDENAKLKRLVADLSLDKAMLQDVVSRKL